MWKLFQTASDQNIRLEEISRKLDVSNAKVEALETKNIELERRLAKMEDCYAVSAKTVDFLKSELVKGRRKQIQDNQYGRLENIEISGIPAAASADDDSGLEDKVIKIAKEIGVNISARDISACHRLRGGKDTIIRFVNRKDADAMLSNASKLKDKDLSAVTGATRSKVYVNVNLSPDLKSMRWKTKRMKESGLVAFYGVSRRGPYVQTEMKGTRYHVLTDEDLTPFLDGKDLNDVLNPVAVEDQADKDTPVTVTAR